jgi:SulP family sulfate permease
MARFYCADCDVSKQVPDAYLGRKVRCPGCGRDITVRAEGREPLRSAMPAPPGEHLGPSDRIPFQCAACGHVAEVPERFAGRKARCPKCGEVGSVSASSRILSPPSESDVDLDDLAEDFAENLAMDAEVERLRSHAAHGVEEDADLDVAVIDKHAATGALQEARGGIPRRVFNGFWLGLVAIFFSLGLALVPAVGAGDQAFYPYMLQMALAATVLGGLAYALLSRIPFASAGAEGVTGAGLFLLAQAVAGLSLSPEALLPTLVGAVLATALVSGLLCILFSQFQEGGWMRFVPFPVIGGVLAGVGVLLLQVSFRARTGLHPDLDLLLGFLHGSGGFSGNSPVQWLPSLCFGLLLFLAYHRIRAVWWLAAPLLLGVAWCFAAPYLVSQGGGAALGPELVRELSCGSAAPMSREGLRLLHSPAFLAGADWSALLALSYLVFALALLLAVNASSKAFVLEEHLGREVSPGPELRALGVANLLSGLAVGFPVSMSLGRSLGTLRAGGVGRLGSLVASLVCAAALVWGGPLIAAIPPFIPAGLLCFMGLNLIKRWLVDAVAEDLRSEEFACLLLSFAVTVGAGFAPGVVVGVLLALMLGLARHSSSSAIKSIMSGDTLHSNVDRAPGQADALRELGQSIFILRMQGFLSGGSLSAALRAIWERLEEPGHRPLRFVVLDFTQIKGFGSGLPRVLGGMAHLGRAQEVRTILTNVPFVLEERLEKAGLAGEDQRAFVLFRNLDFALEWCEDKLLEQAGLLEAEESRLEDLLAPVFPDRNDLPRLLRILQRTEVRSGEYVFRQGDASDSMFFVESGMLTVELEIPGGKTVRLKKLGPGSIFGEMGIYTHSERSASVRANEQSVVQRLSKKRLAVLKEKLPQLATSLDRFLVTLLARRVADANVMVRDLMR